MQRDQVRQIVTSQVYQSLADNNVQIKALPPSELQALINALADGVFAALVALEDESQPAVAARSATAAPVANATESDYVPEQMLWRGRPYLSIGTRYEVTNQRLRIIKGILGNVIEEIELIRVRDTRVKQHLGERMLDVGDITVISEDATMPETVLHNVSNPLEVRELIRKATIEERQRRGVLYREDVG
jgi:hypothetical protein